MLFVYVGFNVFNVILATQSLQLVLPGGAGFWYPTLIILAVALAVVGYDLLHFVQRWLTYLMIAVFGLLTISALTNLDAGSAIPDGGFSWASFLITFGAAAGYQISYAVYVSDYSRYLPSDVSAKGVISWTYAGAAASAVWLMSLGALFGSSIVEPDAIGSIQQTGNALFGGFGTFVAVISVPALVSIMAINFYGAMLTGASAVDGFVPLKPNLRSRVVGIVVVAVVAYVVALVIPDDYLGSFNNFVLMMLYFLIPWTAVNLVDFYFVRRGHYAIAEIFKPSGIYGRWSWRGLVAYVLGFAIMVPFITTTFYEGFGAKWLGGADISFAVGLLVTGLLYFWLCRGIDLDAEAVAIAASERELEGMSSRPRSRRRTRRCCRDRGLRLPGRPSSWATWQPTGIGSPPPSRRLSPWVPSCSCCPNWRRADTPSRTGPRPFRVRNCLTARSCPRWSGWPRSTASSWSAGSVSVRGSRCSTRRRWWTRPGCARLYRKAHLWDRERLVFDAGGEAPPVVETRSVGSPRWSATTWSSRSSCASPLLQVPNC